MRARLIRTALLCALPIGAAWLVFRNLQWQRRRGFRGHYEQPVEPWGDVSRVPVTQPKETDPTWMKS